MTKFALLMITAVAFAAPALAEDAAVPPAATQAPTAQGDTNFLDRMVCKKLAPPTGTRLGARKVCQTEREWRDLMQRSQDNITRSQQKGGG